MTTKFKIISALAMIALGGIVLSTIVIMDNNRKASFHCNVISDDSHISMDAFNRVPRVQDGEYATWTYIKRGEFSAMYYYTLMIGKDGYGEHRIAYKSDPDSELREPVVETIRCWNVPKA